MLRNHNIITQATMGILLPAYVCCGGVGPVQSDLNGSQGEAVLSSDSQEPHHAALCTVPQALLSSLIAEDSDDFELPGGIVPCPSGKPDGCVPGTSLFVDSCAASPGDSIFSLAPGRSPPAFS